ncbi:MAG TPA: sulfite exporter TauE/SafE family protein [Jiangellaceae bacterium]
MTPGELTVTALAGVVAGAVNAVAGGGSMLSFPVLIWLGLPPLTANVTNTAGLLPGYLASAVSYRHHLREQTRRGALAVITLVGAVLGCVLLLVPPAEVFEQVVPFLLVAGCLLIVAQPRLSTMLNRRAGGGDADHPGIAYGGAFVGGVYGAYFGAGLGVMLFAVLSLIHPTRLQRANALKVFLSLLINAVAVVAFALFGPVEWSTALVLAVFSLVGGYLGARVAQRMSDRVLRIGVLAVGVASAVWLLLDPTVG